MLFFVIAALPLASASTMAGLGVPAAGGSFAHPSEAGTSGLVFNPAAAHTHRAEFQLDAAALWTRYAFELEGQSSESSRFTALIPFLAAVVPIGRVALGAVAFVPYARDSDDSGPQSATRYYSRSGSIQAIESDLSVAVELPAWGHVDLVVGAGPRALWFRQASLRSFDTGAVLHDLLGADAEVPLLDPFLEGTQSVVGGRGTAIGWAAGVRAAVQAREGEESPLVITADVHSALTVHSTAEIKLQPSNDLNMVLDGIAFTDVRLPASANAAVRVRVGQGRLLATAGWIGWSSVGTLVSRIEGLEITSPDPLLTAVLDGYGLSEADLLPALGTVTSTTGMRDTWSGAVAYDLDFGRRFGARAGAGYFEAAVPTDYLNPGNADFAAVDLSLAGRWAISDRWSLGLGTNVYPGPVRRTTQSIYALTNPSASGLVYPSGNGRYSLGAARLGLTVRVQL